MSMNRTTLIQGFLKIFFPMLCGEVVGMLVGIGVGTLLGMERSGVLFIVLPIMAGGVGEGRSRCRWVMPRDAYGAGVAWPGVADGDAGSLTAIVISGCLNQLGKRFLHLTGKGTDAELQLRKPQPGESEGMSEDRRWDPALRALLAVLLYMMGMLGHKLIVCRAPVGMLFLAVLLKLANVVSPRLQEGSQMVYKFFRTAVTYPILLALLAWRSPRGRNW